MGDPSTRELFVDLTVRPRWRPWGTLASLVGHGLAIVAVVLVPLLLREPLPAPSETGSLRIFVYDPPPPPPPPPLRYGTSRPQTRPVEPASVRPPTLTEPDRLVQPPLELPQPVETPVASDQPGVPTGTESGSLAGSEYGMEGGVPGGVVGGVPGGVLGGVIGGTGTGLVPERRYDRAPVALRLTRPAYPHEAFVKKIEGRVLLQILIDSNGRVVDAKVVQSMPPFDDAAIEAVRQWLFAPAMKDGRPVVSLALAPITFQIY